MSHNLYYQKKSMFQRENLQFQHLKHKYKGVTLAIKPKIFPIFLLFQYKLSYTF